MTAALTQSIEVARAVAKRARGYAFLFTLLLVALLGVGLVVTSEIDTTLSRREREQALLQIGHEFRAALARYQAARPGGVIGRYPLELRELVEDPRFPRATRHLRRVYVDPMTHKAEWGVVRQDGRIVGVYSLSTDEPLRQDNFDEDDAAFKGARRYRDWVFLHPPSRVLLPAAAAASSPTAAPPASAPPAAFAPVAPVQVAP